MSMNLNEQETTVMLDDESEKMLSDLQLLGNDELLQALNEGLGLTVKTLMRCALIIRILVERGVDLSERRLTFRDSFLKMAYGQMLPELFLKYIEKPASLTRLLSNLPKYDQKRIVEGKPVELVVRREGGFAKRLADPAEMQPDQLKQVFGHGSIRSEAAQINLLESQGEPVPDHSGSVKSGPIVADRKRGCLKIGHRSVTVPDVLEALSALHPGLPPDDDDDKVSISVKLSPIERKRLQMAATRAGHTPQTLIYRAIMLAGLLAPFDGE